jgi:DNA-binding beta-propeller fold protein YncE
LTITFVDGGAPKYGTVEFDAATGAYTYTPNLAGRLRAGLGRAADGFTVLVERGAGAQAAYAPLAAVSEAVTVGDIPIAGAVLNVTADPVAVGVRPVGVAVSPDGARVFVIDAQSGGVHAIAVGAAAVDVDAAAADTAPIIAGGYRGPNDYYVPNGGMAFSADGTLLYVSSQHAEIVGGMFMPATGDIVVIGNDPADPDTYLKVIGEPIDAYAATLQLGGVEVGPQPLGTTVSPDGSVGYVVDTASRTISVLDLVANEKILDVPVPVSRDDVDIVGVGPDGTTLYLGDSGGETVTSVTLV